MRKLSLPEDAHQKSMFFSVIFRINKDFHQILNCHFFAKKAAQMPNFFYFIGFFYFFINVNIISNKKGAFLDEKLQFDAYFSGLHRYRTCKFQSSLIFKIMSSGLKGHFRKS